jgi:methylenetetrahydrofolate--tRNA-(uracil-5-)-methyltransferase
VTLSSIDEGATYRSSRYGKGDGWYVNCPMTKPRYEEFVAELKNAETAELRGFEDSKLFGGCLPAEVLAGRGTDTLRFGPMKPKGLPDPRTGIEPYAAVQLRCEDTEGRLLSLVGFQTRLRFGEQKRVFSMIPGLERAEFVRYGVMHRNAYINSPAALDRNYASRRDGRLYFAGQISGVEGYVESVSSGLTAGICSVLREKFGTDMRFPPETLIGALAGYVSNRAGENVDDASKTDVNAADGNAADDAKPDHKTQAAGPFQPMNANFGLLPPPGGPAGRISKRDRNAFYARRSLAAIDEAAERLNTFRNQEEPVNVAAWQNR